MVVLKAIINHVQLNLSKADMLKSGHLAKAEKKF